MWPTLLLNIIYNIVSSPTVGQGSANGWQTPDTSSGHFKDMVAHDHLGNAIPFSHLPTGDTTRDRLRRFLRLVVRTRVQMMTVSNDHFEGIIFGTEV